MIPPSLDFSSDSFDPVKALHSNKVPLPHPKAKTYNNIAEYYSHTFLKNRFESNDISKKQERPRERNYEWYYDTLGLSEYQRNQIRCIKSKKRRKRKKPVSLVTIPGSPLRSEKVTVCKSDFKDYCRRKYRSWNATSAIVDINSKESKTFLSNSASKSSFIPSVIKSGNSSSLFTKHEREELLLTSSNSMKTQSSVSLFRIGSSGSSTASHVIKDGLPSASCIVKTESSDDDSLSDDILILKMKSNVQKGYALKNAHKSPVFFQLKPESLELSKNKSVQFVSKCVTFNPQVTNDKLSKIFKPAPLNFSKDFLLNNNETKCSSALYNSEIISQIKHSSSASVISQEETGGKCDGELKLQSLKSATQNIPCQKVCHEFKENNCSTDVKSVKKCKKSILKSQENVLDCRKVSTAVKVFSKSNNISMIKIENSPIINHCTCNFTCGLSHLCTCGYYANAKEALRKFKIPHKKK